MSEALHPPRVWPLVGAEGMRALDRHTIDEIGVAGDVLMESAGRAAVEEVLALRTRGEVVVVCGGGNNGGDGFVVARHLHQLGVPTRVALIGAAARLRGDAATNYARALAVGVRVEGERWRAPREGVLVDALFGTGLTRELEKTAASSVRRINQAREQGVAVVALDLPSGICSDSGRVLGCAVQADVTVSFGLPKLGLAIEPGRSHAGAVRIARIGIADEAPGVAPLAELWTGAAVGAALPPRPAEGHKGRFGHVLLVAGSEGKTGAAALAAEGAARTGAGLVTVGCPSGVNEILEVKCTEAMTVPLPDTPERSLAAGARDALVALARERSAVGMGPGLGRAAETEKLVRGVVDALDVPHALDADALHAFAGVLERLAARRVPRVLTPHPGEAAALLGSSAAEVNAARVEAAGELAARTGSVVLLKGAASVIAGPDGRIAVNATGGPALGTGGTGDVLLGMVSGLLAQGSAAFEAAVVAAHWHGLAADRLTERMGPGGLLAGDVAAALPETGLSLRQAAAAPAERARLVVSFPEP